MAPTKQELSLLINPLVPEAVQHNNRVRFTNTIHQYKLQPQLPQSLLIPLTSTHYTLQKPLFQSTHISTNQNTYRSYHPSTP